MLNQSKSNIKNTWKYFVILPALALFLMSFNVETIEVEKETEAKELPIAFDLSTIAEDNLINNRKTSATLNIVQKIIQKKIHKDTTDKELETISEELKKNGILFTYKNVKRNANNEITGISITYKDIKGNSGNYALSSEHPINTFHFYKEENGSIGFKSENVNSKQRVRVIEERREQSNTDRDEMMKDRERMMEEREHFMEEHKEEMKERRKEIEIRVKEAREEHEKTRDEYQKERKIIIKERMKLHDSLKDKHGSIFIKEYNDQDENNLFFAGKDKVLFIVDGEESDGKAVELISPENIAHMNVFKGGKALNTYGEKGKDGVIVITTKTHDDKNFVYEFDHEMDESNAEIEVDSDKDMIWISKNNNVGINMIKKITTDAELKSMKSDLEKQNIDFKYSKLKRNKNGDITRIKISLNDNDGNKSSSTFDTGNNSISPILIGKNKNSLIIKSI